MKLTKLFAALGLCAAIAPAAYAAEIDVIYNGDMLRLEGEIINDRTMVSTDSLEALGISVYAEGGFWDFKKNDLSVYYDEIKSVLSGTAGEIESEVMPVMTSDGKLVPLRAFAEYLGIAVGWDEVESLAVLIDYDTYFEQLKTEKPELYALLSLSFREAEQGVGEGKISMSFDAPGESGVMVKLDLALASSIADGVAESGIVLNELTAKSAELDFVLNDVTLDGVYDVKNQTIYFKTNAIEKIRDIMPEESRAELDAAAKMFKSGTWYKLTMQEYMDMICEMVGIEKTDISDILNRAYADGISIGDILRISTESTVDDIYAFEMIEAMADTYAAMLDSGMMKVENSDEGNASFAINCTTDTMVDFMLKGAKMYDGGYEPTEEEILDMRTRLEATGFELTALIKLADGVANKAELKAAFDIEGVKLDLTAESSFDPSVKPEPAAVPESAVNLLPLISSLMGLTTMS